MAPTTRADNKNKHPGYCVLSKAPSYSPSKTQERSQLERDNIVKDIEALEAQLRTKQQQSRSMARQPPGPSQVKQLHTDSVGQQHSMAGQGAFTSHTPMDKVLMYRQLQQGLQS